MVAVVLMTMMCVSCANSPPYKPVYPPAPDFMYPVPMPLINLNDDARIALAKNRAALIKANNNLKQSFDWYKYISK